MKGFSTVSNIGLLILQIEEMNFPNLSFKVFFEFLEIRPSLTIGIFTVVVAVAFLRNLDTGLD